MTDPRIPRAVEPALAQAAVPKAELRRQLRALRRGVDAATRQRWDAAIGAQLLAWWQGAGRPALGVYWPLRDEPDLLPAYAQLAALGAQLLLPVVLEKDAPLAFARWEIGETMVSDAMGVSVPARLQLAPCPPALLIPCLGFNGAGFRLGYGGGFYDRTLAQTPRPATLGVAYACQLAEFGNDAHDVALDRIVTEAGGAD